MTLKTHKMHIEFCIKEFSYSLTKEIVESIFFKLYQDYKRNRLTERIVIRKIEYLVFDLSKL